MVVTGCSNRFVAGVVTYLTSRAGRGRGFSGEQGARRAEEARLARRVGTSPKKGKERGGGAWGGRAHETRVSTARGPDSLHPAVFGRDAASAERAEVDGLREKRERVCGAQSAIVSGLRQKEINKNGFKRGLGSLRRGVLPRIGSSRRSSWWALRTRARARSRRRRHSRSPRRSRRSASGRAFRSSGAQTGAASERRAASMAPRAAKARRRLRRPPRGRSRPVEA